MPRTVSAPAQFALAKVNWRWRSLASSFDYHPFVFVQSFVGCISSIFSFIHIELSLFWSPFEDLEGPVSPLCEEGKIKNSQMVR